jgi:tetratricopeptide (TPR) repeat protein
MTPTHTTPVLPPLDPFAPIATLTRMFALAGVLATAGCSGLDEAQQAQLSSYKQRSKTYYETGHFERAEDQCRRGRMLEPDDQSLLQVLGMSLLKQTEPRDTYDRRLQEAALYFERAIETESEFDFRNRSGLGEVLTKIVSHRLAQIDSAKAASDPNDAERAERLARLETDLAKRTARAREVLNEVLAQPKSKDNELALSTLARLEAQVGNYEASDELLTRLAGVLTRSIHLRGQQLEIQSWPAEVRLAVHSDVDRLEQTRIDTLKLRTTVLTKLGRHDEVVTTYAEIEADNAMQPADYFNRAASHTALGRIDSAIADYDKFITLAAASGVGLTDTVREAMERKAELSLAKRQPKSGESTTTPP